MCVTFPHFLTNSEEQAHNVPTHEAAVRWVWSTSSGKAGEVFSRVGSSPRSVSDIANWGGRTIDRKTASNHLKRFVEAGLVEMVTVGRRAKYRLASYPDWKRAYNFFNVSGYRDSWIRTQQKRREQFEEDRKNFDRVKGLLALQRAERTSPPPPPPPKRASRQPFGTTDIWAELDDVFGVSPNSSLAG